MDLMDYRRKIIENSPHLSHAEGSVATFSDGTDSPLNSMVVSIEPSQSGTGDPSPTNFRPISGWDAINIYDDPIYPGTINWNQKISNREVWPAGGSLAWNNNEVEFTVTELVDAAWKSRISFLGDYGFYLTANDKFIFSFDVKPAHTRTMGVYIMVKQGSGENKYIATQTLTAGQWNHVDIVNSVSADVDTAYLQISVRAIAIDGYAVGDKDLFRNVECFNITQMFGANHEPSTILEFRALFPNDYYSYNEGEKTLVSAVNGMPYIHVTIDLGQTVYGATLNPLTGVLTAYPYYASYNGETLTGRWVSDRDKYVAGTTPTIGAQVVDMSGTGTEVQLTPQQIRSLYGNNTIFADTGNVALEYWAHP